MRGRMAIAMASGAAALVVGCAGASPGADWDAGDFVQTSDGGVHAHDASDTTHDGATSSDGGGGTTRDSGGGGNGNDAGGGGGTDSGGGGTPDSGGGGGVDSGGGGGGGQITCPGPGSYTHNGGGCGSERWNIKTGTDSTASSVSLVPRSNTIAALVSLSPAGGGTSRSSPTETTIWELKDVTLSMIKLESDSDYHIVLSDGSHTMVAEIPYPDCAVGSAWSCFISRVRAEIDAQISVSSSPKYPSLTVTVRGVGFFDFNHGQTGVAPNAIELHPILEICFGQGCTPG